LKAGKELVESRKFLRNLSSVWGLNFANILVAFIQSPFIIGILGDARYGVWSILSSMVGYLGLADLGLRRALSKYLNEYLEKKDVESVLTVISTSMVIFTGTGIVIVLGGLVACAFLPYIFKTIPPESVFETRIALMIMSVQLSFSFFPSVLRRLTESLERFDISNSTAMISLAIRTAGIFFVLKMGWGLIAMAGASMLSDLISTLILYIKCKRIWPRLRFSTDHFSKEMMFRLWNFGLPCFVDNVAVRLNTYFSTFFIGMFFNMTQVTYYGIARTLTGYINGFLERIVTVLTPAIFKKTAVFDYFYIREIVTQSISITTAICVPTFVLVYCLGNPFIELWLGQGYDQAKTVLRIVSFSMLIVPYSEVSSVLLVGLGRAKLVGIISSTEAVLNIGSVVTASILLPGSLNGVAIANIIPMFIIRGVYLPLRGSALIGGSYYKLILLSQARVISISTLYYLACREIMNHFPVSSWLKLVELTLILSLAFIPFAPLLVLSRKTTPTVLVQRLKGLFFKKNELDKSI
jgi:O-antigen/teichoic acid export membrane protein